MDKKTIIVTGGAGFIGSNFIYYMLKKYPNYRIVCLDSLTYAGNLSTLKKAMENDHLLTLSCFHRRHHNEATARYCVQLASKSTKLHTFFLNENDSLLEPVYRKVAWHRNTKLFYGDR
jgi:dTDP-D-glucose 4,6-dehydratase